MFTENLDSLLELLDQWEATQSRKQPQTSTCTLRAVESQADFEEATAQTYRDHEETLDVITFSFQPDQKERKSIQLTLVELDAPIEEGEDGVDDLEGLDAELGDMADEPQDMELQSTDERQLEEVSTTTE